MEVSATLGAENRRSRRGRAASSLSGGPDPGTPTGSESPRSETSEGRGSRSSRLSNPEFAAKHKAFMAKVTASAKGSMESYLTTELVSEDSRKRKSNVKGGGEEKRRRNTKQNSNGLDTLNDAFCWICHKEGDVICCETCPRVFHLKCIGMETNPSEDWVCPECVLIMTAENMDTRSRAMRLLTVDQLCTLLKHALARMKSVPTSEPFVKPVDPLQFPAYKDYISCPMDIQSMERNIRRKQYGSTEAMLADCKWILHNCIIFNSTASKLTTIAKNIVKVCKHEMQEIENCPDCYLNAHIKKDTWFTEACRFPHCLVWAKLKGFPFWPGKIMRVNSENNADIRFFGAHDRAWIALKDVYLYSSKPPLDIKKKRGNLDDCVHEVQTHIRKLTDRFGEFALAPNKTQYDPSREEEMLKTLFPKFTLPFEIGSLARRARSYSFTGSERSRGGTPTPSETSMVEDEEEGEEVEEEVEKEEIEEEECEKEEMVELTDNLSEDKELVEEQITEKDVESHPATIMQFVNECESEPEPEDSADVNKTPESGKAEDIIEKIQDHTERVSAMEEEELESTKVAEKIIDDSIEKSVEEAEDVLEEEVVEEEHESAVVTESTAEENTLVVEDNASSEPDNITDLASCNDQEIDQEKTTSDVNTDPKTLPETEETSHTLAGGTEDAAMQKEADRTSISPPCEVSSTTATPGPSITESQTQTKENDVKDTRIHGVIVGTNEPVIIEDEEQSDEIDDVEPDNVNQSEDESNDVMEVQDDEDVAEEIVTPKETNKLAGETSKAGANAGPERPDSEIIDTSEDSLEPKSSQQEPSQRKAPVDPSKLLAAGVSITVIDKKNKAGDTSSAVAGARDIEATADTEDLSSDISVTLVQKSSRTDSSGSSGKFTLSLKRESELLDPEKAQKGGLRKSLDEERAPPDPIVTISKISGIKESNDSVSTASTEARRLQMSASSPGPHHQSPSTTPSPGPSLMGHRMPGFRGPGHMGPRGPMMNMGPMMRGQFRGPMPGPGGPLSMPNLQPRPSGIMAAHPSLPSAAGPVAEQLNRVAGKLADYMRQNLEDLFKDLSQQGSPEATIKGLQLELEKMQWRHQQEMAEVKHNADLVMMEMRAGLEQDKQRTLADCRKQAEIEKQKAIAQTKKKQWCAMCGKEAIFYCCWNTSYCDYPCQQAHWPAHMSTCAQNNADGAGTEAGEPEPEAVMAPQLPQHFLAGSSLMSGGLGPGGGGQRSGPRPSRGRGPGPGIPSSMSGMRFNMQPRLPGNFNRPYFM